MDAEPNLRPLLVFDLRRETFGLRLGAVREIFETEHLQRVPRAPALIRGLADVRGRMVTVLDLDDLLGGAGAPAGPMRLMLLAEPRDHLAFGTSAAVDLVNLDLDTLAPRPAGEGAPEVFEGFVASGGTIVNVLSTEKILLLCEREILKRFRVGA